MTTVLDYIRIRGYEGGPDEAFQGIGGGDVVTSPGTPTTPPKPGAEKDSADGMPAALWAAQQRLVNQLTNYLSKLTDVTGNQEFNKVLTEYITVLTASGANKKPNWSALNNQLELMARAETLWTTGDHNPSKEVLDWLKDADDYSTKLEKWFEDELAAQSAKQHAQEELAHATTDAEKATAQQAFAAAQALETTADSELPANNPVNKLVALIAIARALMAGQWVLAAIIAIRMGIPMFIDYIAEWLKGKLPGSNPTHGDLEKIRQAITDLQFNDLEFALPGGGRIHLLGKWIQKPT